MPELFSILILVEDNQKLPPRRNLVNSILSALLPWPTQLGKIMLFDFDSGEDKRSHWDVMDDFVEQKLSRSQAMFLYSVPSLVKQETISSISISEVGKQTTISIAIEASLIVLASAETVQEWLIRLHKMASCYSRCIVAAGSELGFDPMEKTIDENAQVLASSFMNAFWVVLPDSLHIDLPSGLKVLNMPDRLLVQRSNLISSWFRG